MAKMILQVCGYAAPYAGNFIATMRALSEANEKMGYQTIFAFPESAEKLEWCNELRNDYKVYFLPLEKARIRIETYRKIKKWRCEKLKFVNFDFRSAFIFSTMYIKEHSIA